MNKVCEILFSALRSALFGVEVDTDVYQKLSAEEWTQLYRMSAQQGVMAIVYDVVSQLPKESQPPRNINIQWALSAENISKRYEKQKIAAINLSTFLSSHNIHFMIIKGLGLSKYYPNPKFRECGDIDIYTFGDYEKCNELIRSIKVNVNVENSKHSTFVYSGVMVENHKTLINTYSESGVRLNSYLEEIASKQLCMQCKEILFPNNYFNVLFLLRHMLSHLSRRELAVRNVVDWGLFLDREFAKLDKTILAELLSKYQLVDAYNCFISVAYNIMGGNLDRCYVNKSCSQVSTADKVLDVILCNNLKIEKSFSSIGKLRRLFSSYWMYKELIPDKFWGEAVCHSVRHYINELMRS